MDYTLACDELSAVVETIVRDRIGAAQDRAKEEGITLIAAYLRNRFEELGARISVVREASDFSSEYIYMIFKGSRPLSERAALAISTAYPDISLTEIHAVGIVEKIFKERTDA